MRGVLYMNNGEKKMENALRWGMIGGGRTSQVGYKHRSGALRDRTYELVAGAFDIDTERGKSFGINLGVDPERCYDDYQTLLAEEAKRDDGVEVVSIATPNGTHYEITMAALEAGLHVICEKPLVFTTQEAEDIKAFAEKQGLIVGVTYGYSGNSIILQMKAMIEKGQIGDINLVEMQYTHGYAGNAQGDKDNAAQKWRVDPKIAGPTFVIGDLSIHTYYISKLIMPNLNIKRLLCDRQSFVGSRYPLEDNAYIMMHYDNGAVGRMWTSAVDAGQMDGQRIRIVGSKGSLEWWDSAPNELQYQPQGAPTQILYRGAEYLDDSALQNERLGILHQEGLTEAWGNIYLNIALAIDAKNRGDETALDQIIYPDINSGIEGVRWIENCVASADKGSQWVDYQ